MKRNTLRRALSAAIHAASFGYFGNPWKTLIKLDGIRDRTAYPTRQRSTKHSKRSDRWENRSPIIKWQNVPTRPCNTHMPAIRRESRFWLSRGIMLDTEYEV